MYLQSGVGGWLQMGGSGWQGNQNGSGRASIVEAVAKRRLVKAITN
jgi:hypothetical protein